jgi:hypothetical protein
MTLAHRLGLLLLVVITPFAQAKDADAFFPIMAWNHAPGDAKVLAEMHDCGITVAGFVNPKHLDLVQAAGMKAIVNDPRAGGYDWANVDAAKARANVKSLIDEVGNHPAVFGYYLRDEPPASYFAGLEKVASVIRELAPGKWPYINLFPNYADQGQLAAPTYEKYLDDFVATCKPPILSYDHYALLDDGALGGNYFNNLEQMRGAAKKADAPFWNIVLSCAHFAFREPTASDLRFEAYTTLAYGGRGLSYFTYFCPQVGNYRAAPIDQFGHKTPTWYAMQNVNLQVLKLAPTLLKLHSDDVYHFGKPPPGCHGPTEKSLLAGVNDNRFMAGDFTHDDGSRYVMIVNTDVKKSAPCVPQYRSAKKVQMVSPYSGELIGFEGEQVWLAPGAGALLKLEN